MWKQQPCQVHNLKEITVAIAGHPTEPVQVCPLVTTLQHFIHTSAEMIEAMAIPLLLRICTELGDCSLTNTA